MSTMEKISELVDDLNNVKMQAFSRAFAKTELIAGELGGLSRGKKAAAIKSGTIGDKKVVQHTIYDHRHKTSKQVEDILMNQQELFLATNPDYQYDGYRTQDGVHGERIVFLMFKKKGDD